MDEPRGDHPQVVTEVVTQDEDKQTENTSQLNQMETLSVSSSSYAGSASSILNVIETKHTKITNAFSPLQLDRPIALETQISGQLKSDTMDVLGLLNELDEMDHQNAESQMTNLIKKVKLNIQWLNLRVTQLEKKTQSKFPVEYHQALNLPHLEPNDFEL